MSSDHIRALEEQRAHALQAGHWDDVISLFHPDLRYTHASGSTDKRDDYADRLRTGFYDYSDVDLTTTDVIVRDNLALVWGTMQGSLKAGSDHKDLDSVTMTVWVMDAGSWLLIAARSTPIRRS